MPAPSTGSIADDLKLLDYSYRQAPLATPDPVLTNGLQLTHVLSVLIGSATIAILWRAGHDMEPTSCMVGSIESVLTNCRTE